MYWPFSLNCLLSDLSLVDYESFPGREKWHGLTFSVIQFCIMMDGTSEWRIPELVKKIHVYSCFRFLPALLHPCDPSDKILQRQTLSSENISWTYVNYCERWRNSAKLCQFKADIIQLSSYFQVFNSHEHIFVELLSLSFIIIYMLYISNKM